MFWIVEVHNGYVEVASYTYLKTERFSDISNIRYFYKKTSFIENGNQYCLNLNFDKPIEQILPEVRPTKEEALEAIRAKITSVFASIDENRVLWRASVSSDHNKLYKYELVNETDSSYEYKLTVYSTIGIRTSKVRLAKPIEAPAYYKTADEAITAAKREVADDFDKFKEIVWSS